VVTLEEFDQDRQQLLDRIEKLRRRARVLAAVVRLLFTLLRISGFRLSGERLPAGDDKGRLLRAIAGAEPVLPLVVILRIAGMTPSRYHAWQRATEVCGLDDRPSCPRSMPSRLTCEEVAALKDMVLDPGLRHMPLRTLSLFAQRAGKVFVSVTTWARLVREHGWRRPRMRVHPAKPTLGVRASRPNEYWHLAAVSSSPSSHIPVVFSSSAIPTPPAIPWLIPRPVTPTPIPTSAEECLSQIAKGGEECLSQIAKGGEECLS
jgi:hypothetical protein